MGRRRLAPGVMDDLEGEVGRLPTLRMASRESRDTSSRADLSRLSDGRCILAGDRPGVVEEGCNLWVCLCRSLKTRLDARLLCSARSFVTSTLLVIATRKHHPHAICPALGVEYPPVSPASQNVNQNGGECSHNSKQPLDTPDAAPHWHEGLMPRLWAGNDFLREVLQTSLILRTDPSTSAPSLKRSNVGAPRPWFPLHPS
jgi:hypothetical protein